MPEPQIPRLTFKSAMLKAYRLIAQPRVVHRERLIVERDEESCPDPIFLVGPHRSGTTLVRQIVDSHSRIACPPESFFLERMAGLVEAKDFLFGLESMGFDRAGVIRVLKRASDTFFESYRLSKGKARWADKTPQYVKILPFIEEMYGPGCQYVMIYRHPFDVVDSLHRKRWELADHHEDPFINLCMYVADALQRMEEFESRHPDRCCRLFYGRLMERPEEELRRLFEFLGESWEEGVLRFNDVRHDWGAGDTEAMVFKGFRPSGGNWKEWSATQVAVARQHLQSHLDRLGFEPG